MYSRIERGKRKAKREQVDILAEVLNAGKYELTVLWLADKIHEISHMNAMLTERYEQREKQL